MILCCCSGTILYCFHLRFSYSFPDMYPKHSRLLNPIKHLVGFAVRFAVLNLCRNSSTMNKWYCNVLVKIITSSMKLSIEGIPYNNFLISRLKPAEAFTSPNGITLNWSRPSGVWNAVISLADFSNGRCQYPLHKSSFETYLHPV